MKKTLHTILGLAASVSLAACGANPSSPTAPTNPANISSNVLQFAVGTANYAGTASLNVVATYREGSGGYAPGDSGTLINTPTITLPGAIAAAASSTTMGFDALSTVQYGPATSEVGGDNVTGSSQAINTAAVTSFGQSGGVFGTGIEPYNATGPQDASKPSAVGAPFTVPPYAVPLYDAAAATAAGDPNMIVPWGGPPAFTYNGLTTSVAGTGVGPTGTDGIELGIDVFDGIAPVAGGTYKLSVNVPANTGAVSQTASFTMPAALTTIATPANPAYAGDAAGDGGGALTGFTMPANATEAMIEVVDYGPAVGAAAAQSASCNGSSEGAPVYYTFEETASAASITVPAAIGPNGAPTICTATQNTTANKGTATTADQVVVQVLAFDYPWYEAQYPATLHNPSPTILGANKSDDIAISAAACSTTDASACDALPLIKKRQLTAAYAKRMHY